MSSPPVDTETGEIRVRPLADTLRDLGRGKVVDEAAVMLQQLTKAVEETGKKGRLIVTVEVSPMKGDSTALLVHAKADVKMPPSDAISGVFFPDADGNLLRDDPRQIALPLRELNGVRTSEIKDLRHG